MHAAKLHPDYSPAETRDWPRRQAHIDRSQAINRRGAALAARIQARAWALAATVDIPRDGCCLHNASIDDGRKGWCAGPDGAHRLRVAKHASRMFDEAWKVHTLAERAASKEYARAFPHARFQERPAPTINLALCFAVTINRLP